MRRTIGRRGRLCMGAGFGVSIFVPAARACELITSTLRVTHPWTRATGPEATTAVLCMKFDEVQEADRLISVQSPVAAGAEMAGAGAEMAGAGAGPTVDFVIPRGGETLLSESGTYVRLTGLKFPLLVGRSYPLTLGFEKAGNYIATLSVDYSRFT